MLWSGDSGKGLPLRVISIWVISETLDRERGGNRGQLSVLEESRDSLGGHRCKQYAVAVVAAGDNEAWRDLAEHRGVVGCGRTKPDTDLDERPFAHSGHHAVGLVEQSVDAASGRAGVESLLLDSGAEHDLTARASDDVHLVTAQQHTRTTVGAQAQDLALDGTERELGGRTEASRPGAGRKHHRTRTQRLGTRADADDASGGTHKLLDASLAQDTAAFEHGHAQRSDKRARVDLRICRGVDCPHRAG